MPPVLQIVEVISQSEQGKTLPYLCRGDDNALYYVKGQQTNRSSLWAEWICAHAAQAMGLAIPPFQLVQVDEDLVAELPRELQAIGCLPAFGSLVNPRAAWLELALIDSIPEAVQRDVLVFDWWVRNTDRLEGNTNLLWDADRQSLVVIDHNMALQADFDVEEFLRHHVFAKQWDAIVGDLEVRDGYHERLAIGLAAAREAAKAAPEEWLWENSELDVRCRFNVDQALATLARCTTPELWRTE